VLYVCCPLPADDIPGLRNITVQVDFQRGGRTVYTTTTFAGYIGALSGMRPGAFSIVRALPLACLHVGVSCHEIIAALLAQRLT
jgi:hypothetical protein